MNAIDKLQHNMTDEIAYQLGKFDFPSFYSYVMWYMNKEPFPLLCFFDWGLQGGTPCKQNGDKYDTDWSNFHLMGKLKPEKFETLSQKLAFIRGRLDSYSVTITPNQIEVCWANSYDLREIFAKFLNEILFNKFTLSESVEEKKYCWNIRLLEDMGTFPGTPSLSISANREVINYIVGK